MGNTNNTDKGLVDAIHVTWTRPMGEGEKIQPLYELLCTILSILNWRKYNGKIKLYTDAEGYAMYSDYGLLDLWDDVDTYTLMSIPESISAKVFWAGAKAFALSNEAENNPDKPIVMIDTDMVIWDNIKDHTNNHQVVAFHQEPFSDYGDSYPSPDDIFRPKGYSFPAEWNFSVEPCNTALTYYASTALLKEYTSQWIRFMKNNTSHRDGDWVTQMVFAEQRILPMVAAQMGIDMGYFVLSPYDEGNSFTHLWGAKSEASASASLNFKLCYWLVQAIVQQHPYYEFPQALQEHVKPYLIKK